jgi:hypothetical protein
MGRFVLPLAQVLTSTGRLGAGYKLYFYTTGTSTPLNTYSDSGLSVPNSNPVIADANGLFDDIFLANSPYKVVLKDADGVEQWSADPVTTPVGEIGFPVPIASGGTGQTTAALARTALGLGTAATYTVGTGPSEVPTNANVSGVPTGGIIIWYGSLLSVPTGWAACDGGTYSKVDGSGSIATPDLRDRFVIGATLTYAQGSSGGSVAGATTGSSGSLTMTVSSDGAHDHGAATGGHTLTTSQIPAHTHPQVTGQGSSGSDTGWNVVSNATPASTTLITSSTGGSGSHSHSITAASTHTHTATGGAHTHSISGGLPPYYALIWIMRL